MPDTMIMFEPLSIEERAGGSVASPAADKAPIIPVPADAPPMRFRHPKYGYPTAEYAYHVASGELAGYACRFDFIDDGGKPDKKVLPITFCDLANGTRAWRSKGIPAPRPLYRLPEINARPDAPVMICEGEKPADAAAQRFPEYVATSPMHGAKSPQHTDWTPLAGRWAVIWRDNDRPGEDFAQKVAALVTKAGAAAVSIVPVPNDWPATWDLADPVPDGVDPNVLHQLLASAVPWEPSNAKEVDPLLPTNLDPMPPMTPMPHSTQKPYLIVQTGDLPATARQLRDLFASRGYLFDRDRPVKVVQPADGGPMIASELTPNGVVIEAHRLCQPMKVKDGTLTAITLPDRVARMYLDMHGERNLPSLAGISTAPLLSGDGRIHSVVGYDQASGLWCCKVPQVLVPPHCSRDEAGAALLLLRDAFKTFPFADAVRRHDPILGVDLVDLNNPPGRDESAMLTALLTAVCRASLWLAPGMLIVAPQISGAGSGKGLVVKAICLIAFGSRPKAFTAGHDRQELDKRFAAELVEAAPALFLDNVNGTVLRSETLASVLTERPARVRQLGSTLMLTLNSTAFIAVTGNGLTVSEDLARRFVLCRLDAQCEDPEARDFSPGFLDAIERRRAELLGAALTIWRYGRQNRESMRRGRPLGSFETWCEWVRDPLLTLGCCDPVEQVEVVKAHDPHRRRIAEIFAAWNGCHGDAPIRAADLADDVRQAIDPQGRGRQFVAAALDKLSDTRAAGFVLTRQESVGKWGAATYALLQTAADASDGTGHRDHRGHEGDPTPMTPMPPMPPAVQTGIDLNEDSDWRIVAPFGWRERV